MEEGAITADVCMKSQETRILELKDEGADKWVVTVEQINFKRKPSLSTRDISSKCVYTISIWDKTLIYMYRGKGNGSRVAEKQIVYLAKQRGTKMTTTK